MFLGKHSVGDLYTLSDLAEHRLDGIDFCGGVYTVLRNLASELNQ